jgi:hypothetical protein
MTFKSNRLIAISGLARLIHSKSKMDYLAGLWRKTLAFDLLWVKPHPRQCSTSHEAQKFGTDIFHGEEPTCFSSESAALLHGYVPSPLPAVPGFSDCEDSGQVYIAPSWSWAAVEGNTESALLKHSRVFEASISFSYNTEVLITVLDAAVTVGGEPTSEPADLIDGSYVRLKGPVKTVCLTDFPFKLDFDIPSEADLETEYVCLAVYSEFGKHNSEGVWWGLLLRHVNNAAPDVYERCGIATVHGKCSWPGEEGWSAREIVII